MTDVFDKKKRSQIMSKVRGKNTKPELLVRSFLHRSGFRFRVHDKTLPGCPDIKLTKYKTAIFVNGCFWHGHAGCLSSDLPKSNFQYWKTKIERNTARDTKNIEALKLSGWKVIIVWECELKKREVDLTLNSIVLKIVST